MFSGARNPKFNTSLLASWSPCPGSGRRLQQPPALPGPPAPGYTVTCCSGSQLHLSLPPHPSPPLSSAKKPLSPALRHSRRAAPGGKGRGEPQHGDPQAGLPGGLCLPPSFSVRGTGLAACAGRTGSLAAGEWQQDLTRRARKTGRELTGAERTAGDESGFSAPVSPSLQTLKLHIPLPSFYPLQKSV